MKTAPQLRSDLVDFVERDLIGPAHGEDEILEDQPRIRYVAGVLFPQESVRNESAAAGGVEEEAASAEPGDGEIVETNGEASTPEAADPRGEGPEADHDETVTLANTYRPSAMGLSFMVEPDGKPLWVEPRAATYAYETVEIPERRSPKPQWRRHAEEMKAFRFDVERVADGQRFDELIVEGLKLRGVSRPRGNGRYLVTLSLYDTTLEANQSARTFFQVGFRVRGVEGEAPFVEYRLLEGAPFDREELELQMLYRNRRIFAVGHGCAAEWSGGSGERAACVETSVMPKVIVPPVDPHEADWPGLSMSLLSGDCEDPARTIPESLEAVCGHYESWIEGRARDAAALEERFVEPATRHLALCRTALCRMRAGIDILARDETSRQAFMLANRAMLMQQLHSRLRRALGEPWMPLPSDASEYRSLLGHGRGRWRTFQIAFILMLLPGIDSADAQVEINGEFVSSRDLVDLIWFPTGGGKTEAYLGAAAYTIFRGRLEDSMASGCKVLMRYTLRLLTSQQFQRAASLICACELIRREAPERFGQEPISIGLWVGMSLTPNEERDALAKLRDMSRRPEESKNPFQLLSCPWCGTRLDDPDRYGYSQRGGRMIFLCPARGDGGAEQCPFSRMTKELPVCVVDESIYASPPTLLIGTVDKFAMLAWRERAGAILTSGGGPELIIQDELHLISGPLGSMVGLYEVAIEFLCSRSGRRPKVVASTATIRRAATQCFALYGRPMFQFPPPALDASDSFFARENRDALGRVYVGLLPTAASSPLTAQIRSVVALQQGALLVGAEAPDEALDPYWTLVQYFGSLKELGRAATFVTADIPEFLPTMHRRYCLEGNDRRWTRTSEELTSRKNEEEIPQILKRLETRYGAGKSFDDQALDTVLATNMISVGVDIDRLGLMMIVTQPKGTSEYIQASSRVGRSRSGPGLVFTLYNASRPRDRSHYEHFRGYHESFYRFVEPTSVTPFSPPAMERALHAVLVIGGRHVANWDSPRDFDRNELAFEDYVRALRERVRRIDRDHEPDFEAMLQRRLSEWESKRPELWGLLVGEADRPVLMRPTGTQSDLVDPTLWDTPTSMRNVDVECVGQVVPRYGEGTN
jgi:hypothetical protein